MQRSTRERIKASCLKLLAEKPTGQLTVKAIVEDCGVNRNTFYYHFADVPTLLTEIATDEFDRVLETHAGADSLEGCIEALTDFAQDRKNAVMHLYRSVRRDLFEQYLSRVCYELVSSYCQKVYADPAVSEADWEIMLRYYQCELLGQTLLWLESGMRYDARAQFARLLELRRGFGAEMVRRSKECK